MSRVSHPVPLLVSDITVHVVRKKIKYLHLRVLPPHGFIRVSAPWQLTDEQIRLSLVPKLDWLKKHQQFYLTQVQQHPSELLSGEYQAIWGQRYPLALVDVVGKPYVQLTANGQLQMGITASATREQRLALLEQWYRQQLKQRIQVLGTQWQRTIGVEVKAWGVKKMRTRWGSCNTLKQSVWLNLELAKKSPDCLEYVVVHELVHLLERSHNQRFQAFMDKFLPDWRQRKQALTYLASVA